MINGEVKLYYWAHGKGKKSFGHVALEIIDANEQMTYISYVPHSSKKDGYIVNDDYEKDRIIMGEKFHDSCVNLLGLDIEKMIQAHEEYKEKFISSSSSQGYRMGGDFFSAFDYTAASILGNNEDGTINPIRIVDNHNNCSSYIFDLLCKGGIKMPGKVSKTLFMHTTMMQVFTLIFYTTAEKDFLNNVTFLFIFFYFAVQTAGIITCCRDSVKGNGLVKTPTGIYELAKMHRAGVEKDITKNLSTCDNKMVSFLYGTSQLSLVIYMILSWSKKSNKAREIMLIIAASLFSLSILGQVTKTCKNRFCFFKDATINNVPEIDNDPNEKLTRNLRSNSNYGSFALV